MGVQPIVQLWVACTLLSLPALTRLQSASAAESEWTLSTKDTEIKIGIRNGADAILELHTTGNPWEWVQSPVEQSLPNAVIRGGAVAELGNLSPTTQAAMGSWLIQARELVAARAALIAMAGQNLGQN